MAHFARIRDGVIASQDDIHVVANDALDPSDEEGSGQVFLAALWGGDPSDYIQCSYNATFRGPYPSAGWSFDAAADAFVPPVADTTDSAAV